MTTSIGGLLPEGSLLITQRVEKLYPEPSLEARLARIEAALAERSDADHRYRARLWETINRIAEALGVEETY